MKLKKSVAAGQPPLIFLVSDNGLGALDVRVKPKCCVFVRLAICVNNQNELHGLIGQRTEIQVDTRDIAVVNLMPLANVLQFASVIEIF